MSAENIAKDILTSCVADRTLAAGDGATPRTLRGWLDVRIVGYDEFRDGLELCLAMGWLELGQFGFLVLTAAGVEQVL